MHVTHLFVHVNRHVRFDIEQIWAKCLRYLRTQIRTIITRIGIASVSTLYSASAQKNKQTFWFINRLFNFDFKWHVTKFTMIDLVSASSVYVDMLAWTVYWRLSWWLCLNSPYFMYELCATITNLGLNVVHFRV